MSEKFYNAIHGTGSALKKAWDKVTGNDMLKKRGIKIDEDMKPVLAILGGGGGMLFGVFAGMITESLPVMLGIMAAGVSLPVTVHLPYALYKAGEHDAKLRLASEKRACLEGPKPALPKPPDAPLI
jgi:hypothetical protein